MRTITDKQFMRTISRQELIEGAKSAYLSGRLPAELPEGHENRVCLYRTPGGYNCIIGAVLRNEELDLIAEKGINSTTVNYLLDKKIVKFEDFDLASDLQNLHDAWCRDDVPEHAARTEIERLLSI